MSDNPNVESATATGMSRYGQIARQLQDNILAGEWPPGSAIPAESALASQFGIALGTIRQAIAVLVRQGLLERVQGKGTFVRNGLSGASMMRFFRFRSEADAEASPTTVPRSEILSCRSVRLDKAMAARFAPSSSARAGARGSARGLVISRRRWVADHPRLLESIWLPLPACAPLQDVPTAEWGELLYPMLSQRCGITVHRAMDEVTFRQFEADEAELLALPASHPCALVTRQAFDIQGQCVEYRLTRGDAYAFRYTAEIR